MSFCNSSLIWKSQRRAISQIHTQCKATSNNGVTPGIMNLELIYVPTSEWLLSTVGLEHTALERKQMMTVRSYIQVPYLKCGVNNILPPESLPDVSFQGVLKELLLSQVFRDHHCSDCFLSDNCYPDGLLGVGFPTEHNTKSSTIANMVCSQAHFLCVGNEYS